MTDALPLLIAMLLAPLACAASPTPERPGAPEHAKRPVATYSVVARDGATGRLGVAVQSHWFDVASVVPWAEAGIGAVATQSLVERSYGPLGIELMRAGEPAPNALRALVAIDKAAHYRQVAMIDAAGNIAQHTGADCIREAGHVSGETDDGDAWACQANLMHEPGVPLAMSHAFRESKGQPLAERLMLTLEAAQHAGGDARGKQSASILVVSGDRGETWRGQLVDLRVASSDTPLEDLRRLLTLHRAYEHMNKGDHALERGDLPAALKHYNAAQELDPSSYEMAFWTGVALAQNDRVDDAIPFFRKAFADPKMNRPPARGGADWPELLRRLPESGLFPSDRDLIQRITSEASAEPNRD